MKQKREVLADHKKEGSRFIPPLVHKTNMQDVSYSRTILPESLWIAVLTQILGGTEGLAVALQLSSAATNVNSQQHFAFCSQFGILDPGQRKECVSMLDDQNLVSIGLAPLVFLYPDCPLNYLCKEEHLDVRDFQEDVEFITSVVRTVEVRHSKEAMMMQAGVIYLLCMTGKLHFMEGVGLENLPEIERYPDTEVSCRVAASIRATLTALGGGMVDLDPKWQHYFWNRGLEISDCEVFR